MQQDPSERRLRDINRRPTQIYTDFHRQGFGYFTELGFLQMGSGLDILTILRKVSGSVNGTE